MEGIAAKVAADPLASLALAAFGFAVLRRLTLWKTVRRFAFPVAISLLVYRQRSGAPSLLDAVHAALQPRQYLPESVVYLLRDLAGLLLILGLSSLMLCAISPVGKPLKTAVMDWAYSLVQVKCEAVVVCLFVWCCGVLVRRCVDWSDVNAARCSAFAAAGLASSCGESSCGGREDGGVA